MFIGSMPMAAVRRPVKGCEDDFVRALTRRHQEASRYCGHGARAESSWLQDIRDLVDHSLLIDRHEMTHLLKALFTEGGMLYP